MIETDIPNILSDWGMEWSKGTRTEELASSQAIKNKIKVKTTHKTSVIIYMLDSTAVPLFY